MSMTLFPAAGRVGHVTPCAPRPASTLANGAHGVTRPTTLRNLLRAVLVLACLLLALPAVPSRAALSDAAFESANKLYEEGKFAEAASAYEKVLQGGQTSAALCFNLGNAFFKSGQIGRAIAAYRQAERLAPRDPDLRANLQFARNQTQGPTLAPSRWQRWLGRLTLNEWTVLAAAAVWLWLLLLAVLQWRPRLSRPSAATSSPWPSWRRSCAFAWVPLCVRPASPAPPL